MTTHLSDDAVTQFAVLDALLAGAYESGISVADASRRITAWPSRSGPGFQLRVAVDRTRTVDDGLSRFLTARWGLFENRLGRTRWLPNEHEPWVLHPARVTSLRDELVAAAGVPRVVDGPPDSVLFSPGVDARFGRGETLGRGRPGPRILESENGTSGGNVRA